MSEHALRLWDVAGTWISGLGSLGAVIVSLWLAQRAGRIRLAVKMDYARIMAHVSGQLADVPSGLPKEVVCVDGVNHGLLPVVVTSFGFVVGFPRRSFLFPLAAGIIDSTPLPASLSTGQRARYAMSLEGPKGWVPLMVEEVGKRRWPRLAIHTVRPWAGTTVGPKIIGRANPLLREKLLAAYRAKGRTAPSKQGKP